MISLDLSHAKLNEDVASWQEKVNEVDASLQNGTCTGNDFIGWLHWDENYDKEEFARILETAKRIQENSDVLVVCGIGGSYLGPRAAIEMVNGLYPADQKVEVIYTGNTFSSTYINQVMEYIKDKRVTVNVISKSGTTTETAIAFRILEQFMWDKYGEEAKSRIIATTDKARGTLKNLADTKGYETFVIPDDIGGRFSVITPVGLLPIAVAGISIEDLMKGLNEGMKEYGMADLNQNPAYAYAVARRILQNQGYDVEMFVEYEPQMQKVAEWWKQLFGESEGKDGLGILPDSAVFSTDLHSLGQFIQDGKKVLFETNLYVDQPPVDIPFPSDEANMDNMNYLAGKNVDWVNKMAAQGTLEAHEVTGNVPNIVLTMPGMTSYDFGNMCAFFFKAIAMTTLLNGSNPFNQPGVEVYKKNMFKLLGKE
ncbi:glucose-6-phosphate isomerase [Ileibacterium valens]|uniref:Glucose-6-phosphate isomerase n=1 Tax=Ileibacterium valens TaxID=1862668 RepID=A0A1U7NFY6_9FIRM|nr:glucose-6-phosphate isomerase [Ileibacterium valens]OLU38263.1 glucose-6-phosphate isomerase [Erysipelotrichaceae bacterium NYU-BL-E8]OLU39573.1 glucose-6-phosphate isomerase [Ileibacterium valens]OLU40294.1 glucose-6-phosphate isomerase [Erysipelotrichaceae bacterium NYU-BL-F16]